MYIKQIKKEIENYLKYIGIQHKRTGKHLMLHCPMCESPELSANEIPNIYKIHCFKCPKDSSEYDLFDIVKVKEPEYKDKSDKEIADHLKKVLNLDISDKPTESDVSKIFDFYKAYNFSLTPLAKNSNDISNSYGKMAVETDWTNKEHRNIEDWYTWHDCGLNIGIRTGNVSGIIVLDIDAVPKELKDKVYQGTKTQEELEEAIKIKKERVTEVVNKLGIDLSTVVYQDTFGGIQVFYKYTNEFKKGKLKDLNIDIETDGGQVAACPSIIGNTERKFIGTQITEMPENVKQVIRDELKKQNPTYDTPTEQVIYKEALNFGLVDKGKGRSEFLIKMGGAVRNEFNAVESERIVRLLNRTLCNPPIPDIGLEKTVLTSIRKYTNIDDNKLANSILEYLNKAKAARKDEIETRILGGRAKGEDKERIDKALIALIENDKIFKKKNEYILIEQMSWEDTLVNKLIPITEFKVPYFHDYNNFCWNDLTIIGASTGVGKTHLAMNIIHRLVKQGIKPYYIYNESGARWAKIALELGLKDKDFYNVRCPNPENLILRPNSVVIYDWIRPPKGDGFARMDELFFNIVDELEKTKSFMMCFVQLRKDNTFFAPDQIDQAAALACKYMYVGEDGLNTKFMLEKIREPKEHMKKKEIPCVYDWKTKEVKTQEELEREK